MNILCIGAHPDDIEIGCAGTIKRYVNQGAKVYYLIATLGEKVSVDNTELLKIKDSRTKESIKAAKYIGASDIFMLNLNDTRIKHDGDTVKAIEKKINEINPDYIFTHTVDDNHQDHKNIALSSLSACRRRKCNILHYESPSTAQHFVPTVYSDITDTVDNKIESIKVFLIQRQKVYVDPEAIKGLAKYRGYTSGIYEYAEAFSVTKIFL